MTGQGRQGSIIQRGCKAAEQQAQDQVRQRSVIHSRGKGTGRQAVKVKTGKLEKMDYSKDRGKGIRL